MAATVEFHFDFGSPNAYLAHRLVPEVAARTGARFVYVPVLLGGVFKATNNASPMQQFAGIPAKLAYMRREMARFAARHGLAEFAMNPHFPVNTVQIMRGAVVAQEEGRLADYVDAVFAGMWARGLKLDDPAVIRSCLDEAGLDGGHILGRIGEDAIKQTLIANTEASVARGSFGSPSFYLGEELYFGKDSLPALEADIARAG
jgi:2-hydroxychromene-2-carboxylate isomerase